MLNIHLIHVEQEINMIRELFYENLCEVQPLIASELNMNLDVDEYLENNLANLNQFTAPYGGLFIAQIEGKTIGCAGFRQNSQEIAEVKRMYVKPEYRRQGIGRALLQTVINQTRNIGYKKLRLDTACFAKQAQALYHSFGFQKIPPYLESDIPEYLHPKWVFMELQL